MKGGNSVQLLSAAMKQPEKLLARRYGTAMCHGAPVVKNWIK